MATHASGNTTWFDYPNTSTPISAASLENVEAVTDRASAALDTIAGGGRSTPAFFRAFFTTTYSQQANTDIIAGSNWSISRDTDGGGATPPGSGSYTTYTIPLPNRRWDLLLHFGTGTFASGASMAGKILRNSTTVSSTTAIASGTITGGGGEAHCNVVRFGVALTQGDVLRWSSWANSACTIGTVFGHPPEIIIRDAGPA